MRKPLAVLAPDRAATRDLGQLRLLLHFLKPYRRQLAGALLALTIAAVTVLALGQGLRDLVDHGFAAGNPRELDRAVIVLFGVTVLLAVSTFARYYLVTWVGERVVNDLRRAVFDRVIRLSPAFFEMTRTGEVLSRLTTDTTLLQLVVGSSVSVALRNALLLIGGTIMLLVTSWKLTVLVFLVVPLVLLPILTYGRRVRRLSRESQDRVADVSVEAEEVLREIRTVQAFNHEGEDRKRFADRLEAALVAAIERTRARAMLTAIVILLVFGSISAVLWIGGHDVLAGRISPGDLSAFVFYAIVVAGSVGAISEVYSDLQRAAGAMERLMELLKTEPQIQAPARPVALPVPARGEIRFETVTFRYPTRLDRAALDAIDLAVAPGERVALVGPSGAGKTTIFQLLLRFYDPDSGRIRLDGVDIRETDPAALRARIGFVAQEPAIFAANVADNIRYGRPDATDDEIAAAAKAAHATEFIERLPQGFATELGERGVRLSGGQRQRIAIARAILRNPAVLLLDEATSALDAESERAVQQALDELMQGRTTLVIAHRLATVLKADRIAVLDHGRIVASGTHEALMREQGLYRRLAELQFDRPFEAVSA
ncbi:MAG: ABC transporter transmembrane domain-containing protein [Rhodospirillaceae bacterium]|nr:ABC transporter transmembrane domain-containing protein [Rhodospirillaceae bacterium]